MTMPSLNEGWRRHILLFDDKGKSPKLKNIHTRKQQQQTNKQTKEIRVWSLIGLVVAPTSVVHCCGSSVMFQMDHNTHGP